MKITADSINSSITTLSDRFYFSVEDGADSSKKMVHFVYKGLVETNPENLMLAVFPPDSPPVEIPMQYDSKSNRYEAHMETPDICEMFLITTAKNVGDKDNENAPVLQRGFISLKDGIPQPVNKIPGVPEGTLETLLLRHNGDLIKPDRYYSRLLMRQEEPRLEDIQIDDLVALNEDGQLTVYWIENGRVANRSFSEAAVQSIVSRLPAMAEESSDLKLIGEIASQYGCSTLQEGDRFVTVYLPPGYDAHRQPPYKLQLTLDGGQYLNPMQMNIVMDNLIESGEIESVITLFISPHSGPPQEKAKGFGIVMPKGYSLAMRLKEYSCHPEFADKLAVLPATMRQQFNVSNNREDITIWGVSAGGLQAAYTGLLHPDVFGNVVAESPESWNIPEQNGTNWREGIVDTWTKEGVDITWSTATATLLEKEGAHNEHITQMVSNGYDSISGRKLDESKPVRFYLDAGSKEAEYDPRPEVGSANLLDGARVFAAAAKKKGHIVVDEQVHVIPNGGHHNMTWMRNQATIMRTMHAAPQLSEVFIKNLQAATNNDLFPEKFWKDYSDKDTHTFEDALNKYAEYYLANPAQQKKLSAIFWDQIKSLGGTPIIEDNLTADNTCNIYFLFPKDGISESKVKGYELALMSVPSFDKLNTDQLGEKPYLVKDDQGKYQIWGCKEGTWQLRDIGDLEIPSTWKPNQIVFVSYTDAIFDTLKKGHTQVKEITKKDLYLQGDFHGYGATDGRQRLSELSDTGIMWHKDTMPGDAIIVYKYIQVEPNHRGLSPIPELPPFFTDEEGFVPRSSNTEVFPEMPQSECEDEYSTHISNFPGFNTPARIIRVSTNSKHAHITGKPIDWPGLLSAETPSNARHFVYYDTLYSDRNGELHRSKAKVKEQYHDDLHYSDQGDSPYADFTRNIQVFTPSSGTIDDIVVVNDGIPYLITGILDHFEKLVNENKLSPNTVFVFIHPLPGLKKTLSKEAAIEFEKNPLANTGGMGVRVIDFKDRINEYVDFIADKLFPQLQSEIGVPDDPSHRVMIGSSLSGTASIYIGLKRPDLFGAVIAQSPSPANRAILSEIPREMLTKRNIYLSCGVFEHPDYAAANANVEYAAELKNKLGIPLHTGAHGHEFIAWIDELEQSLPATLEASHALSVQGLKNSTELPSVRSHSIFSQAQEFPKSDKQEEKTWVQRKRGG